MLEPHALRSAATCTALLAIASIAACTSDSVTGEEAHQTSNTVEARIDVSGDIRGAFLAPAAAEQSWKDECARFEAMLTEISAPSKVTGFTCGEKRQLAGGSSAQFASTATATIVARVPKGVEAVAFEPGRVVGVQMASPEAGRSAWLDSCEASLRQAKALYGDRLLAAVCGDAKSYIMGSSNGFGSTPKLWLEPARGGETTVEGFAQGSGRDEQIANTAWRASCDAWLLRTSQLSGIDHLGTYTCGERKTLLSGSSWAFESTPSVKLAARLIDDAAPTIETFKVHGERLSAPSAAKASAVAVCEAEIAKRKEALGEAFLGASCASFRAVLSGSSNEFEVEGTVLSGELAPNEEVAPEEEPIAPSPTGPDPNLTEPAENCTARCLAMMDACDAGPRESICQGVCNATPSEGSVACAEQVACENIGDWWNVCGFK